jgi:hypothetical protein
MSNSILLTRIYSERETQFELRSDLKIVNLHRVFCYKNSNPEQTFEIATNLSLERRREIAAWKEMYQSPAAQTV